MTTTDGTITKGGTVQNVTAHWQEELFTPRGGPWVITIANNEHFDFVDPIGRLPCVAANQVLVGSNTQLKVKELLAKRGDTKICVKKEETKDTKEELLERTIYKMLHKYLRGNFASLRVGTGFVRNFTVTNNIPLSGSSTINLVVTTMDASDQTSWGDLLPVAWKGILFNRNSVPATFMYQDLYQLTTAQIDSKNKITPGTSTPCSTGDQWDITGTQPSPLWEFDVNSGGNPINATNKVKNSFFNIGFVVNNLTAAVKTDVNYMSYANFNPTPQLYFTVVSQVQQSQVLTSAVASQTFACDMSKYTSSISVTIAYASDGSTNISFA